jgi:hypothetical protein
VLAHLRRGASLADTARMTKIVLLSIVLASSSALAEPKTLQLGFALGSRHYNMKLVPDACGSVEAKAKDQQDEIKVCARPDGKDMRLEIDWMTRQSDHETRNRSTVIATRGETFDLDAGSGKLTVSVL